MARPKARHQAARPPARPGGRDGVALAFARDREGRLTPARGLDETSRRARAPFTCPGCGDQVVARLGAVRARHFAHRPGSACPLTAPETALHFNAKQRLLALCAEAFAGERRVTLLTRCTCRRADPRDLAALGDAAAAEGAVGGLRADVLVTRAGAPALAVEVLVTHAVDDEKAARLGAAGVPAVEVDARAEWEREGPSGAVEVVCERSLGFPPCPACRAAVRAEADRAAGGEAAEIAELEAYRARGLLGRVMTRVKSVYQKGNLDPNREKGRRDDRNDPGLFDAVHDAATPLTPTELTTLGQVFECPDCRSGSLEVGTRLVRHRCPGEPPRPVAWRGYDGRLAELGWWKR